MSKPLNALGLMSGTSLDGIDVALLRTDGEDEVLPGPAATFPYSPDQQSLLQEAISAAKTLETRDARPDILAEAEQALTRWHAEAVEAFLAENRLARADIDVVGFHGQTVIHRPERRLTVQLGDGPGLARRLGLRVVHDMRAADVAAGGQGAPLVPVYHRALAARISARPLALVNIGGVANLTWIGQDGGLVAFDTGPGNALINDWSARHTGLPYDRDGALAARGKVQPSVLAALLDNPYFGRPAPKSLDRNAFDPSVLEGLSPEDGSATLTRFTAEAIAASLAQVPERPRAYVICGGGRRNPSLLRSIIELVRPTGADVLVAEDAGFDGDAMEAEAWAYLAVRCLHQLPISFPGTTGAPAPLPGGLVAEPR